MAMTVMMTPLKWTQASVTHSPSSPQTLTSALISSKRRSANDVVSLDARQLDRASIFTGTFTKLHKSHTCELPKLRSQIAISKASNNSSFDTSSEDEFLKRIEELASSSNFESTDPQWPEILIKHKANSLDLPFSLQMIKKKQQSLRREDDQFGETLNNSMKKAFASMVFIIRELHRYAFKMREMLTCEDLQGALTSVHREMHASFVWLFSQVFSHTPTFMVYLMILLANFTVHSMANNIDIVFSSSPCTILEAISVLKLPPENSSNKFDSPFATTSNGGNYDGGDGFSNESLLGLDENNEAEFMYFRTELLYRMALLQEPINPLILANFAQFLYLFGHDRERAEEYFKKAIEMEPKDPEAFNKYAEFLWHAKEDLSAAEENYLEAISADPSNTYYAASYANFLWNTGGEGTCFPLDNP